MIYIGEVVKVGRKYFSIKIERISRPIEFHLENWSQKTDYSPDYRLYESEQSYKDKLKRDKYITAFHGVFNCGAYAQKNMTLENLEKAAELLGITIDESK
jgi:hypothetical protein